MSGDIILIDSLRAQDPSVSTSLASMINSPPNMLASPDREGGQIFTVCILVRVFWHNRACSRSSFCRSCNRRTATLPVSYLINNRKMPKTSAELSSKPPLRASRVKRPYGIGEPRLSSKRSIGWLSRAFRIDIPQTCSHHMSAPPADKKSD